MKTIKILSLLAITFILTLTSCDDFGDINDNPDAPITVEPKFILTNAIYKIGDQTAVNGFSYNGAIMQYFGMFDFNDVDHFKLNTNSAVWVNNYKYIGDLNDVINSDKSTESMVAVAKVLKAYLGAQLTDLYGHVPFFEAGDKNILTPKYDSQEDIYTAENGVLDLLEQAKTTLETDMSVLSGDILFHGDKTKWVKFINVLKLKYLLRISDVYPASATKIQEIVTENNLFTSNNDNATLAYGGEPNNWYLSKVREGDFALLVITTSVLDMLDNRTDPRKPYYYKANSNGDYIGITPGSNDRTGNYTNVSDTYRAADIVKMIFTTYSEQEFILAEAALKGYINNATAQTHYNNAIQANFDYVNVTIPADYLTNPAKGKWNNTLENLINQKYLSNIFNGYEAWFDYRRTGFPTLPVPLNNVNSDVFPIRFKYPTEESFTNVENYNAAVSLLGGTNDYNGSSWWDQ